MSENQDTPQSFDLVMGGNNPPKKKIEKPEFKKKINTKIASNSSSKNTKLSSTQSTKSTKIEQSENYDQHYNLDSQSASQIFVSESNLSTPDNLFTVKFKLFYWLFCGCFLYGLFALLSSYPNIRINHILYKFICCLSFFKLNAGCNNPGLVFRFGLPRNRCTVMAIYLPVCIIFALLSFNP